MVDFEKTKLCLIFSSRGMYTEEISSPSDFLDILKRFNVKSSDIVSIVYEKNPSSMKKI